MDNIKAWIKEQLERIISHFQQLEIVRRGKALDGLCCCQREILDYVRANPGCTRSDVANGLGRKYDSISPLISKMKQVTVIKYGDKVKTANGRAFSIYARV